MMSLRKIEKEEARLVVVRPGRNMWVADWSRCASAKHIRRVTGSTWVPTPYFNNVPARVVCRQYAELNPGYLVVAVPGREA